MNYGTADESYIIQVAANDAEVLKLEKAIAKEEAALAALIAKLGQQSAAQLQANTAVQAHAASLKALGAQLNDLDTHVENSGQKFLNFGRLMDDLQYVPQQGLRPIINNVMEMAPAIGIAMIAVQALINNWSSLTELFGLGATQTEAQAMEELGKKTALTADEEERLYKYKSLNGKVSELRTARTKDQRETEKAVTEAAVEAGYKDLVGLLVSKAPEMLAGSADVPAMQAAVDKAQKRRDDYVDKEGEDSNGGRELTQKLLEAKGRLADAYERAAEQVIGSAALGNNPPGLQRLIEATERDPNAASLTEALKAATPEARKAQEADDLDWENAQKGHENWRAAKGIKAARERQQAEIDKIEDPELRAQNDAMDMSDFKWGLHKDRVKESDKTAKKAAKEEHDRLEAESKMNYDAYKDTVKKQKEVNDAHKDKVTKTINAVDESGFSLTQVAMFKAHAMTGGNLDAAEKAEALRLAPQLGIDAAKRVAHDNRMDAQRDLIGDRMREAGKVSHSEMFGAQDFASKIQAGVSNKDAAALKAIAVAEQGNKILASINQKLPLPAQTAKAK